MAKLDANDDLSPVRELVTGRRAQPTGIFFSIKNQRTVKHESRGEKLAMLFAEFNCEVERYYPQPFKLSWISDRKYEYTPDRLDFVGSEPIAIEVKRDRRFEEDEQYLSKLELAEAILASDGIRFKIETRAELESDPRLAAIEAIRYAAARTIPEQLKRQAINLLRKQEFTTLGDLEALLGGGPLARSIACGLVPRRIALFDLTKPLSSATSIRLGPAGRQ